MSEPSQDLNEIEVLLASRQRLNEWLEKLQVAGSKVAPTVRQRVRQDYEGRLAQVVEQLRSHSDAITKALSGLRENATHFQQFRAEEQDTLSEAQLRHVVGEYGDDEWHGVERECSTKIGEYDEEIRRLSGEIGRLDEVLTWISSSPAVPDVGEPEIEVALVEDLNPLDLPSQPPLALVRDDEPEPAPAPAPPPPAPEPVVERKPVVAEAAPEAPRFVPRNPPPKARESGRAPAPAPAPQAPPAAAKATDELAFLKSVSLDPRAPAPATGSASTLVENRTERPAQQQQAAKTLKCGECGALNRPTEWYCERCGAELAAV